MPQHEKISVDFIFQYHPHLSKLQKEHPCGELQYYFLLDRPKSTDRQIRNLYEKDIFREKIDLDEELENEEHHFIRCVINGQQIDGDFMHKMSAWLEEQLEKIKLLHDDLEIEWDDEEFEDLDDEDFDWDDLDDFLDSL